jgi:hypothetical protein
VSVEDDECLGYQATAKWWKMLKKFENSFMKTVTEQCKSLQTLFGISYGVCQEILTEDLNMYPIAPSSQQCIHPHVPENHRVCDWQQHVCRSPASLLARRSPLWFHFVSQFENETEGMMLWNRVTSKGNHKWYSTALRKMTSVVLSKCEKKWWGHCIHSQGDYFCGSAHKAEESDALPSEVWSSHKL